MTLSTMTWRSKTGAGSARASPRSIAKVRAGERIVGDNRDLRRRNASSSAAQMRALLVEDVERHLGARAHDQVVRRALDEHAPRARAGRAARPRRWRAPCRRPRNAGRHRSSLRARRCGCAGATSPCRPKCEMRPTWMRARSFLSASLSLRSTERLLRLLLHVDEVDDDEAGEVAQAQLAGDLVGGLAGWS